MKRPGATIAIVGGTAVAAASALAIAFPPTFQVASWGPWVAVVGGTIAAAGGDRERSSWEPVRGRVFDSGTGRLLDT